MVTGGSIGADEADDAEDRAEIIRLIISQQMHLSQFPLWARADREIVLAAIRHTQSAAARTTTLNFASEALRADPDIVIEALQQRGIEPDIEKTALTGRVMIKETDYTLLALDCAMPYLLQSPDFAALCVERGLPVDEMAEYSKAFATGLTLYYLRLSPVESSLYQAIHEGVIAPHTPDRNHT